MGLLGDLWAKEVRGIKKLASLGAAGQNWMTGRLGINPPVEHASKMSDTKRVENMNYTPAFGTKPDSRNVSAWAEQKMTGKFPEGSWHTYEPKGTWTKETSVVPIFGGKTVGMPTERKDGDKSYWENYLKNRLKKV